MPIKLSGTLKSVGSGASSNDLVALFTESTGINHQFTFGAPPDLPKITAKVELTFDTEDQLTGTSSIIGTIGDSEVNLALGNGPTIKGTLEVSIGVVSSFNENGQWAST